MTIIVDLVNKTHYTNFIFNCFEEFMYSTQIKTLENKFNGISTMLDELRKNGDETSDKVKSLNDQRLKIFDEIRRLRRLEWDETHERVDFDDDH